MYLEDNFPTGGPEHSLFLRAIGWLEPDHPFATGPTDEAVYKKLLELARDPWQPWISAGFHQCGLCQYEGAQGTANLFIPGKGVVYYCPELITHYMNAHHYRPPAAFCDAVLACPEMRSMQYMRALLNSGARPLVHAARMH